MVGRSPLSGTGSGVSRPEVTNPSEALASATTALRYLVPPYSIYVPNHLGVHLRLP